MARPRTATQRPVPETQLALAVMTRIYDNPAISLTELASGIGYEKGPVARIVRSCEASGYVRRGEPYQVTPGSIGRRDPLYMTNRGIEYLKERVLWTTGFHL
jgi:DNA-binding MarR family transcriptional regulator